MTLETAGEIEPLTIVELPKGKDVGDTEQLMDVAVGGGLSALTAPN